MTKKNLISLAFPVAAFVWACADEDLGFPLVFY